MLVDPASEQLVSQLHRLELFDHLITDLLYSVLDHVHLPGDHNPRQLPLLDNHLGLSQLLILKSGDAAESLHCVKHLHLPNFVQLGPGVI